MAVKYVFVTGGVVSGLGKGITAASLGRLLKARGYKVTMQKFDPYINIDPGTMNPIQHGEVFVTDDGAETDLDLGHYERFIDESLTRNSNVTTGKVYWSVLEKERHGDLVDVYGEGVLIMGESGIGKSEAALELIKRGHRLVTDDVVEIRKVSDETLIGASPEITKHFIELRGIGIIDVKALFGVESILDTANIDMVIKLEEWDRSREYDRLGIEDNYTEFLGNKVVCYSIPIRPGRNVAVIVESASVNHRQKKMGYNAAKELYKRVTDNLMKQNDEEE